jgi:hypothetical protein
MDKSEMWEMVLRLAADISLQTQSRSWPVDLNREL